MTLIVEPTIISSPPSGSRARYVQRWTQYDFLCHRAGVFSQFKGPYPPSPPCFDNTDVWFTPCNSHPMSSHSTVSESTTHSCPRDEGGQISCPTSTSQSPILADLLVDGTLSYMVGSRASEWYFEHLLKRRIRRSLLRWDVPGWPGACFTVIGQAQASESEMPLTHHERPAPEARLLDYDVRGLGGTVVPQALWSPRGMSAAKKYVLDATLQWPVFFVLEDRTVGISLQEAVKGHSRALVGAQTHAPLGGRCTLHVRIKVSTE